MDRSQTKKEIKIRRHRFGETLSDNKRAKCELNRFRTVDLELKKVRSPCRNFSFEKKTKCIFSTS